MNKTVLITGASSGIGLELAKIFASKKDNLILVSRNAEKLDEICKKLSEKYGVSAVYYASDLSVPDSAKDLYDEIIKAGFSVDYLINNAGFGDNHEFLETDYETHEKMIKLNVLALTELCYRFGRTMCRRRDGKILNISSVAAFSAGPDMSVYYATKAFVLSLSEALAEEFSEKNVTVTCLCPGPTISNFANAADSGKSNMFRYIKPATSEEVALAGYNAMMKGKKLHYHGISVKAMAFLTRLSPRSVNAKFAKFMNSSPDDSNKHM